jgi:hypothetical protein
MSERRFWNLQPFEFEWRVAVSGHQWSAGTAHSLGRSELRSQGGLFLIERVTTGAQLIRRYKPLEGETGLFRLFAETAPTREGVLEFANNHGLLGASASLFVEVRDSEAKRSSRKITSVEENVPSGEGSPLTYGEPLELWKKAIGEIKGAVAVFDAIARRDTRYLGQFIEWSDQDLVLYRPSRGPFRVIGRRETDPDRMKLFTYGDVLLPAQYFLQRLVNEHIEANPSHVRLLWDKMSHPSLFVCPTNLLSAMWLQLALAIDGDRSYRRCRSCPKWFEVGLTKRRDALTCSDACRKRFSRSGEGQRKKGKPKLRNSTRGYP